MADAFRFAERLMSMDDETWARHSNPWSGITRFSCLPLLILAFWSRAWIGWGAVVPVFLALGWIWWNPRAFPKPVSKDHWMTQAVLGEKLFLRRRNDIAAHHIRATTVLSWLSVPGAVIMVWAVIVFWWEGAVFGMLLTILPKVWFCDRMVWIYRELEMPDV